MKKRFMKTLIPIYFLIATNFSQNNTEISNTQQSDKITPGVNVFYVLLTTFNIWLMQLGFVFLEIGTIRIKHVPGIILKNLSVTLLSGICWFSFGYGFAYGQNGNSIIGTSNFFLLDNIQRTNPIHWFNQFCFCATANTIISGAVAERMNFRAFNIMIIFTSVFAYPIVCRWIWDQQGWLKDLGYHDLAGDGPVHLVGGTMSLLGAYFVGPRIGRFDQAQSQQFKPFNIPYIVLGTLILWYGWYSFNAGSTYNIEGREPQFKAGLININTTLSGSAGGTFVYYYYLAYHKKVLTSELCCGILAGLIGITASCDFVQPFAAVIIDDPLNSVALHAGCGLWGILATGLFHFEKGLFYTLNFTQLGVQALGAISIIAFCSVLISPVLYILKKCDKIRFPTEVEIIGTDNEFDQVNKVNKITLPSMKIPQKLNSLCSQKIIDEKADFTPSSIIPAFQSNTQEKGSTDHLQTKQAGRMKSTTEKNENKKNQQYREKGQYIHQESDINSNISFIMCEEQIPQIVKREEYNKNFLQQN